MRRWSRACFALWALLGLAALPASGQIRIPQSSTSINLPVGPLINSGTHIAGATGLLTGGPSVTANAAGSTTSIPVASSASFAVGQMLTGATGTAGNIGAKTWITLIPDGTHLTVSPALPASVANGDTFSSSQIDILLSKNCGAPAPPAGVAGEIASGNYYIAPTAADTGTVGSLKLHVDAVGAAAVDPHDDIYEIDAVNPYDSVHFGLTSLPNAAASASGGLPTIGTGAGQFQTDGAGHANTNLQDILGHAPTLDANNNLSVNVTDWHGTAVGANVLSSGDLTSIFSVALPGSYSAGTAGYLLGNMVSNIWTSTLETGVSMQQALRIIAAYCGGNTNTTSGRFYGINNPSVTRIQYTTGASGRTITLTLGN